MPTFKSSRDVFQSFNWNNQGYQILDDVKSNNRFKTLRLLKTNFKFRYHREFPQGYKLCSITISKDSTGYYVSFGIEFEITIKNSISEKNFNISNSIGIDLNAYNIAVSNNVDFIKQQNIADIKENHLIDNGATNRKSLKYTKHIKLLERKQSRRVLKSLKNKTKLEQIIKKLNEN